MDSFLGGFIGQVVPGAHQPMGRYRMALSEGSYHAFSPTPPPRPLGTPVHRCFSGGMGEGGGGTCGLCYSLWAWARGHEVLSHKPSGIGGRLPDTQTVSALLHTDNMTVVCYANKLGVEGRGEDRSHPLSPRTEDLLLWCVSQSIQLSAKYVPGKLNILADLLSRPHMVLQSE